MRRLLVISLGLAVLLAIVAAGFYFYFIDAERPARPELAGKSGKQLLTVNGIQRRLRYYVPVDTLDSPPLIFALHGSGGSGAGMRSQTAFEFDLLADEHGFIVVYPTGFENHWNDCRGSADYSANTRDIDDPAFFRAMIDYFVEQYAADRERVYATGFSNGGHMVYRIGLEMVDEFRAIAPVAANMPVISNLDCLPSGRALPVAIFNGTNDPINPWEGGIVSVRGNTSRGAVRSSQDSARYWAELAGAPEQPSLTSLPEADGDRSTSISVQSWTGAKGIEVRLYALEGSGHVIPSQRMTYPRLLGGSAGDISGPAEIVAFFLSRAPRNSTAGG